MCHYKCFLPILFAMFFLINPAQAQQQPVLSWSFAIHTDRSGNPHGKVFLLFSNRRVLLRPDAYTQFHILNRVDYSEHSIPRSAVTACSGWWAGEGEEIYVIQNQSHLNIYGRQLDEELPLPAFRKIKSIALFLSR